MPEKILSMKAMPGAVLSSKCRSGKPGAAEPHQPVCRALHDGCEVERKVRCGMHQLFKTHKGEQRDVVSNQRDVGRCTLDDAILASSKTKNKELQLWI